MKTRKRGLLAKIDKGRGSHMVAALSGRAMTPSLDEILNPGRREVVQFTDEEIAEVIAREPNSKLGLLAAGEMRRRESWQTPAKWSFIISAISLVVAVIALARTF